ncbi:LysR family transcriptional regulator [Clostridiaceae bacterium]|nr:LysR family transcriptional regulator [Clostridiaceae bacterium]RKI17959.1 LysR family transcriptional regulator [bacterium 1XD21-70]
MRKTGAVLVAAGLSSRMGAFKPMLPFGDSTIALHMVSMLKKLEVDPVVVVTGHQAEALEGHLFHANVRFIRNERYENTQMFDSVKLGLKALEGKCGRVMVMPMDLPAILPETFCQVMMVDAKIVRTVHQGKAGHPILIQSELVPRLLEYEGSQGLRGAIRELGVPITNLEVEDEGVYRDVDTPDAYQQLLQWDYERGNGHPLRPLVRLCLQGSEMFFEPDTARLMALIDKKGSVQEACTAMGLSYSKGSRMIRKVERQMGFLVAERRAGGIGGGGSVLTEEGRSLLRSYEGMQREVQRCVEEIFWKYFEKGFHKMF